MRATRILIDVAIATLVASTVFAALWSHTAQAGGVVGPPCDEGALRTALGGGGLVIFNCGPAKQIYLLNPLVITQSTVVDGGGAAISLNGSNGTRLFYVSGGVTLTLRNVMLTNAYSGANDGGAISNDGTLYLENSHIQFSSTDSSHSGGAIFSTGPLFISNSTLKGNRGGSAGAMFINF